jgi:hypothetical protein
MSVTKTMNHEATVQRHLAHPAAHNNEDHVQPRRRCNFFLYKSEREIDGNEHDKDDKP